MKRVLTGIKPTAENLHLGNYFGSIKYMLEFQQSGEYDNFMFLANMHTLTQLHNSEDIKKNTLNLIRTYLASGLDPQKTTIFNPAKIPAHAQLNWVLSCVTNIGYMKRMHAYKDALAKNTEENITVGTFCYPILMAADIILYDVDYVPVGKDQKQHVEYARDIAARFNNIFKPDFFKLPNPWIQQSLATIPGIDGRKMSKSYNNYIGLFDDDKTIFKKTRAIPTASIPVQEPKNPDECNVYNILKLFLSDDEDKNIREGYEKGGLSFKEVKDLLYEKLVEFIGPIRYKSSEISDEEILNILDQGTNKAAEISSKKMLEINRLVGFDF
ncbi:tryptophan--tRNA ligase [Candidatus Absconditicoccus praedator]|uniref:tryptophan--tRNA ligase n=1 Tax=Candidatus Absconditicoccus praedator TaxID=2735562 RepID=UPI001E5D5DF4|nr:tryptophan--tRNA ligase [Candidatus Absconditicoccus praedator]UFX83275.1 tryptophan--tRNA ligase [Candidatus Absconditicoccus praedator]